MSSCNPCRPVLGLPRLRTWPSLTRESRSALQQSYNQRSSQARASHSGARPRFIRYKIFRASIHNFSRPPRTLTSRHLPPILPALSGPASMSIVLSMRRRPAIQPVAVVTRLQFGDADTPLCLRAQIAPVASSAMTEAFGAPSFRSFFEHAGLDAQNAWSGYSPARAARRIGVPTCTGKSGGRGTAAPYPGFLIRPSARTATAQAVPRCDGAIRSVEQRGTYGGTKRPGGRAGDNRARRRHVFCAAIAAT